MEESHLVLKIKDLFVDEIFYFLIKLIDKCLDCFGFTYGWEFAYGCWYGYEFMYIVAEMIEDVLVTIDLKVYISAVYKCVIWGSLSPFFRSGFSTMHEISFIFD